MGRLRRNLRLGSGLVLIALLTIAAPALSAELTRMRIGVADGRTRLVLEFSSPDYKSATEAQADTSYRIRLDGVRQGKSLRPPPGGGVLRSIRVREEAKGSLAIWLSLSQPVTTKVFRLAAEKGTPPRLVVDLVPAGSRHVPVSSPARPAPETSRDPACDAASNSASNPASSSASNPVSNSATDPASNSVSPSTPRPEATPAEQSALVGPRVIVLDAGHGGSDPGATSKQVKEKDICLDVARQLAAALKKDPGFKVFMSRDEDRRIPLSERMQFAEQKNADLFVSIHVNAAPSRRAVGAEVYFLSLGAASDRASRELARLENEVDPDFVVQEDAALRGLPFAVDLRQSDTLLRSSRIAEVVLDVLADRDLAEPRGVKQAGFAVLKSFQVPSILVELGFISSKSDRERLQRPAYRKTLAEALAAGIRLYFDKYAPQRASG